MSGPALTPALARVRLLVLDVDGVLTDGRLFYGPKGELLKAFHVRDGYGIKSVAAAGITVAIISGRKSAAVLRRAKELGIRHVTQGANDKLAALQCFLGSGCAEPEKSGEQDERDEPDNLMNAEEFHRLE